MNFTDVFVWLSSNSLHREMLWQRWLLRTTMSVSVSFQQGLASLADMQNSEPLVPQ
jgi:hypothetical protein